MSEYVISDLPWAPRPNSLTLDLTNPHPRPGAPVTSIAALVTTPGPPGEPLVVLTEVRSRGWDLPGGHLDPGESPDEALVRELAEEAGLTLHAPLLTPLAALRLHIRAPRPEGYPYPYPDSTMLLVHVALAAASPLCPDPASECAAAEWVALSEVEARTGPRPWLPALSLLAHPQSPVA